jgi:KDO2-lipid IV(A) lauroyltransferase
VLAGFIARRTDRPGHVIHIERVELPMNAKEATALLTEKIEQAIRRHPEEWVWFHARWKTPARE